MTGVTEAHCLLLLGDSVTTDHISPAGSIARNSPAARLLGSKGLTPREFNSYGARRGNDAIMARGCCCCCCFNVYTNFTCTNL